MPAVGAQASRDSLRRPSQCSAKFDRGRRGAAHDVLRMLAHGGNPTQLGEALAHFGRIFMTLHVLSYVDQARYRAQIKGVRNLQEGRRDLARHVFPGRRGGLRRAYHEGMEDQLGALGLVLNCITLWSTLYSTPPSPNCSPRPTRSAMRTSCGSRLHAATPQRARALLVPTARPRRCPPRDAGP